MQSQQSFNQNRNQLLVKVATIVELRKPYHLGMLFFTLLGVRYMMILISLHYLILQPLLAQVTLHAAIFTFLSLTLAVPVKPPVELDTIFRCRDPEASYTFNVCSIGGDALVGKGCHLNRDRGQYRPCRDICNDVPPGSLNAERCNYTIGCESKFIWLLGRKHWIFNHFSSRKY